MKALLKQLQIKLLIREPDTTIWELLLPTRLTGLYYHLFIPLAGTYFLKMKLLKRLLITASVSAFSLILLSWGWAGHAKINEEAAQSYNQDMIQFNAWTMMLVAHASDADYRKDTDPTEGPKHYIDIDNYPEFVAIGRIPQTLDSVISIHGYSFVYDQGILPWATCIAFDSLKNCFERNDWDKAVLFAADLGHYVGDGHMPLHITRNYNGQMTGNNGIHSRYESTMINNHINDILYSGEPMDVIPNVNEYIFNYLYSNYIYVDSVLAADDYAKSISGNTNSSAYKEALWNKTKYFTTLLFKNASHALAELIYTAWVEAGSPSMLGISDLYHGNELPIHLTQNIPNPFSTSTKIEIDIFENCDVTLEIMDLSGNIIDILTSQRLSKGNYSFTWNPHQQAGGIYYLVLSSGKIHEVRKMVLIE